MPVRPYTSVSVCLSARKNWVLTRAIYLNYVYNKCIRQSVGEVITLFIFTCFYENHANLGMLWENVGDPDRPWLAITCDAGKMRFLCRVTKVIIQTQTCNI